MQRRLDRGADIGGPPQRICGSLPYVFQRLHQNAVAGPLLEPAVYTFLRFVPNPLEQETEVTLVRFYGVVDRREINRAARGRDHVAGCHLSAKSLEVSVVQQQRRGQLGLVVPRPVVVFFERLPDRLEIGAPLI